MAKIADFEYSFTKKKLVYTFFLFLLIPVTLATELTINFGETAEFENQIIKLRNLKVDQAVIEVGEEAKILEVDELASIGNLEVKLIEIFYIGESEGHVKIDVSSLYVCGDGNCDGPENSGNCCQDCSCSPGLECSSNKCIIPNQDEESQDSEVCIEDEDCDDQNQDTLDLCAGTPKKCLSISTVICETNEDCNDNNSCTEDKCTNNDCFNTQIPDCQQPIEEAEEIESEETTVGDEQGTEGETAEEQENSGFFSKLLGFFKKIFGLDS